MFVMGCWTHVSEWKCVHCVCMFALRVCVCTCAQTVHLTCVLTFLAAAAWSRRSLHPNGCMLMCWQMKSSCWICVCVCVFVCVCVCVCMCVRMWVSECACACGWCEISCHCLSTLMLLLLLTSGGTNDTSVGSLAMPRHLWKSWSLYCSLLTWDSRGAQL
jgi:hypothetical protein